MATVLVVEDTDVSWQLVRSALAGEGHILHRAATADAGLELGQALAPDLILLDFVLPDADGLVLLRELRRRGVDAPVIALTGSTSAEVALRFLRGGAIDFLAKDSLTGRAIRDTVRRALLLSAVQVEAAAEPREDAGARGLLDDPAEEADAPAGPLRVLVVDDTDAARAAVRMLFKRQGWTVDEAGDLGTALKMLAANAPDVVLLDYLLPDADGVEAMGRLRAAGLVAPVVGLTGHGSEKIAERFLRAGAADFLSKDELSEARFVHTVRRVVAMHTALRRA